MGAAVSRRPNQFKFGSPVSRTLTTDAHKRAAVRIINQCDTLQAHMRVMDSCPANMELLSQVVCA